MENQNQQLPGQESLITVLSLLRLNYTSLEEKMQEPTDALLIMVLEILCTRMWKLMFCVSKTLWRPLHVGLINWGQQLQLKLNNIKIVIGLDDSWVQSSISSYLQEHVTFSKVVFVCNTVYITFCHHKLVVKGFWRMCWASNVVKKWISSVSQLPIKAKLWIIKDSKAVADLNPYGKGHGGLVHSLSSLKSANQVYDGVIFIIEMDFVFLIIFVK